MYCCMTDYRLKIPFPKSLEQNFFQILGFCFCVFVQTLQLEHHQSKKSQICQNLKFFLSCQCPQVSDFGFQISDAQSMLQMQQCKITYSLTLSVDQECSPDFTSVFYLGLRQGCFQDTDWAVVSFESLIQEESAFRLAQSKPHFLVVIELRALSLHCLLAASCTQHFEITLMLFSY